MSRSKSLPKVLSREDAARIVCAPDPLCPSGLRNRVAMQLMYRCGLRVGEVCNLQPAHVDLRQGYVVNYPRTKVRGLRLPDRDAIG